MNAQTAVVDPVRESVTGLLRTSVIRDPAGSGELLWQHELGQDAPYPFASPTPGQPAAPAGVIYGGGDPSYRVYPTRMTAIVPELLLRAHPVDFGELGRIWGTVLRRLHRSVRADPNYGTPRSLLRANAWLLGDWPLLARGLGAHGLGQLQNWDQSMRSAAASVVVHGHPGMAHWVVAPNGAAGELLTGEDMGVAHPAYDLCWVLGELAELHWFYPQLRTSISRICEGFLAGYGKVPGEVDVAAGIAFRLVQHAYDWQHYAGAPVASAELLVELAASYLAGPAAPKHGKWEPGSLLK